MWIGLFPEFSQVGGIQQVSRHVGAVLSRRARAKGLPCELLALNDAAGLGSFCVGPHEYSYRGFGRSKAALLAHLLRRSSRIEALFLGHVNLAPLGLLLRLIHWRTRYWVVAHGVEVWQPLPLHRSVALRRARGILAVSAYTAEQAAKHQRLDSRKVFVLPPALDPSFVPAASGHDEIPAGREVLLTVGRLISSEPGKGVDAVIRALPEVLKRVPDVHYVVIGEGDLKPRLQRLAQENAVQDRVLFAGQQKDENLRRYYSRADIYVMPSRQEGFGLVFLEAMACGKPVIAAGFGGAAEIVQEGRTGFLVDPDNPAQLADRLVRLLEDADLRKKMGAAGRQVVEERYTFPRFEERLTRILDAST